MSNNEIYNPVETCRGNETGFHTCGLPLSGCPSRKQFVVYNDGGYEHRWDTEEEAKADVNRLSSSGIRAVYCSWFTSERDRIAKEAAQSEDYRRGLDEAIKIAEAVKQDYLAKNDYRAVGAAIVAARIQSVLKHAQRHRVS